MTSEEESVAVQDLFKEPPLVSARAKKYVAVKPRSRGRGLIDVQHAFGNGPGKWSPIPVPRMGIG